jgi:hypothetical protein
MGKGKKKKKLPLLQYISTGFGKKLDTASSDDGPDDAVSASETTVNF